MKPKVTVIVPTFNHGPTLNYSVGSVLAQTIQDFELFIIGDGVNSHTRQVIKKLQKQDKRIKFFDHGKGPRNGEAYRHQILLESARGEIVCYLADDDMWLPNHLETMVKLLKNADFANTLPLRINGEGKLKTKTVDISMPSYLRLHLDGSNRLPLGCVGHTLRFYKKLPFGWRTTPNGVATDLYMWQQFFMEKDCRTISSFQPTMLHFGNPYRIDWSIKKRLQELDLWGRKIRDQKQVGDFYLDVLQEVAGDRAFLEANLRSNLVALQNNLLLRFSYASFDMPLIGPMFKKTAGLVLRNSTNTN